MYHCERTFSNVCELCGNQSSLFTCQPCIISGNFWVDKANYSYGGKKKLTQKLKTDKENLQDNLAKSYHSSFVYRNSIRKLSKNDIKLYKQRINDIKNKTLNMKEKSKALCASIDSKKQKIEENNKLLQLLKEKLAKTENNCERMRDELISRKKVAKIKSKEYILELNRNIFKIEDTNSSFHVINIPYKEQISASDILKQIKGLQNENESVNTRVVLSVLVHFVNTAAFILDAHLPFDLEPNIFLGQAKSSRLLYNAIKQMDTNVLYLCLSQHVHPELLEPYQYTSNLHQLLTSDSSCGIGPSCYSLDRPGDSEEEEEEGVTSDESDGDWESVTRDDTPQPTELLAPSRSASYIGSLLWSSQQT